MPVTVREKIGRRGSSGRGARDEMQYLAFGSEDSATVKLAVAAASPAFLNDLVRDEIYVEEFEELEGYWLATVRYVGPEKAQKEPGERRTSFRTTGGTQHITQSKETRGKFASAASGTPTDHGGAIGVQGDDPPTGVDIFLPVFEWNERHVFTDAQMDQDYFADLFNTTAHYNANPWRIWQEGEVLFIGAAGDVRDDGKWEVDFAFASKLNRSDVVINPTDANNKIVVATTVYGWDYLWVEYWGTEDTVAKTLAGKPRNAYVERVYDPADFALLNLGT